MNNNLYKFFLFFFLPILFKYLFLVFFIDLNLIVKGDLLEDLLFCLSIVSLFFINVLKKQIYIDILWFLYLLYFVLETTSYLAVSSNFSSSYMYLLIESSGSELNEFATSYANIPIIFYLVLMGVIFFISRKSKLEINKPKQILLGLLFFFGIIVLLKLTGLIENNAYHNIVRGTYGYFDLQNNSKFNSNISKDDITIKAGNEILVVVLGESTTTQHMQIYGYERETTPLLNSIKDSLFLYNDVISTDVLTLKSLPKILTSIDADKSSKLNINIVEVFNKSGFKTYWLSNQRPISYHDNAISNIASHCHQFEFYNHKIDKYSSVLDEIIFPDYIELLDQPGKKVIFLRLLGTHFDYNKRYPVEYNNFLSNVNSIKKNRIINEYDNAILYNDFVVYTFIKELEKKNKKSALLYLSDHGEHVYDSRDFFGRTETNPTKSMFDIPFLVWTSKDFEFPTDFEYVPNRRFMADHTYESIGHLFGVLHSNMDVSKSIFSKSFKERKRKVINGIDYDSYFLKKHE